MCQRTVHNSLLQRVEFFVKKSLIGLNFHSENTVKIHFPTIVVQMVHSDMMCDKLYDTSLYRR